MNSLSDAKSLNWEQTGKLSSHLVAGMTEVATLEWAKRWSSLATGKSVDAAWTFKRAGFLKPRVNIRESGSNVDLAVLSLAWHGAGTVSFTDGESFAVKKVGQEWSVTDSSGSALLTIKPSLGWKRSDAQVQVDTPSPSGRLVLLAMLAWYVILLTRDYDSTVATTTASVIAATSH